MTASQETRAPGDGAGQGTPVSDVSSPAHAMYRLKLPDFEGPLDLLLYLCKTHEIDIINIPIAFVTEKYLEYLEIMQSVSVEVAAEYLVMAATLAYLKSRELVPTPEPLEVQLQTGEGDETDEGLDPKEELIRRLLEYQKYKDAAEKLAGRPIEGRNVFPRGLPVQSAVAAAGLAEHSPWRLLEYFAKLIEAVGPTSTHDVTIDRISIGDRINHLIDHLESATGSFRFEDVIDFNLPEAELRYLLVVTLLAVLELARLKAIRVLQDPDAQTFFVTRVEGAALDQARRAHVTSDATENAAADTATASVPEDDHGET